MANIDLIRVVSDEIVLLAYNGDEAIWTQVRVRKSTTCAVTNAPIVVGNEAFRPIGNQSYRMERIAAGFMAQVIADLATDRERALLEEE